MDDAVRIALFNNSLITNASLQIEKYNTRGLSQIDLSPTEVNYKFGQLYSEENDHYLEINQHFGSILTHFRQIKQAEIRKSAASSEYEIIRAELVAKVKSAYLFWIYALNLSEVQAEEKNLYLKLAEIADLQYKAGDISLLEKTTCLTKVSEIEGNYLNSLDDIHIAENKLHQLLLDTTAFVPNTLELQLYRIEKESDTSLYSGNIYLGFYHTQYLLARTDQSVISSKYFPEFNAGFFTQDITGLNRLYGGQVGLSIPLWIPKNQADQQAARIESEIALNEYEYQKKQVKYEVDNLLLELNKYFRQIRHYEDIALPMSEILTNTAVEQLDKEEIDYADFLESIAMAYKIKRDYLNAIINYNQTALQLEIYAD